MIVIDLGNKQTHVYSRKQSLKLTTNLTMDNSSVKIGVSEQAEGVVYDMVMHLGMKYGEAKFQSSLKYYESSYHRGKHDRIEVTPHKSNSKLPLQTLIGIYIKHILRQLPQFSQNPSQPVFLTKNPVASHQHTYALAEMMQILDLPVRLLATSHAKILTYYTQHEGPLVQSKVVGLLDFSDQEASLCTYRLYSQEQGVVEVLSIDGLGINGNQLTKMLCQYIVDKVRQKNGIDVQRYAYYMKILHNECERAKIVLSREEEVFIRIADLPDRSSFGQLVSRKFLENMYQHLVLQACEKTRDIVAANSCITEIIVTGKSSKLPLFYSQLQKYVKKQINMMDLGCQGAVTAYEKEITILDVSNRAIQVKGEEDFEVKFLKKGEQIPTRKQHLTKFPAGQLQFNLKIFENGNKIAHFILENRPQQNTFNLNFEVNRNGIVSISITTKKGKIYLKQNYYSLLPSQIQTQKHFLSLK